MTCYPKGYIDFNENQSNIDEAAEAYDQWCLEVAENNRKEWENKEKARDKEAQLRHAYTSPSIKEEYEHIEELPDPSGLWQQSQYTFDPKELAGNKKISFNNLPHSALLTVIKAIDSGAIKYGPHNWLELPDNTLSISTYLNAVRRHLTLFEAGQDCASDSKVNHIDHIIAGLLILRDAMIFNKTKDDRNVLTKKQIKILEQLVNNEFDKS